MSDTLTENSKSAWYKSRLFHIAILVVIASFILFPKIKGSPLNDWDEARHAINALEMLRSGNWITLTYGHNPDFANIKFPLGAWLIGINYKLLGINEFSVRLWSVIFTISTTVVVYLWGSVVKNRNMGLLAALIFISSMQVVGAHAGTTGDYDAGASFFLTSALFMFWLSYTTKRQSFFLCSMAAVGLGTMYKSFVPSFIPLVIIFIFLLFSPERKRYFNPKTLGYSALIILGIISPWLIARSASDSSFLGKLLNLDYWDRLTQAVDNHSAPFWFYVAQLKDGFFPWVYALPLAIIVAFKKYARGRDENYLFLLISFFTILFIFSIASTKNFWYILPAFSAMSVLLALFWSEVFGWIARFKNSQAFMIALILFLAFNIVAGILNANSFFYTRKNNNDFAAFLNQESVQKQIRSSNLIIHEYVATQSNLFYLERWLDDKFAISSNISCNLDKNQSWLISSDEPFLHLYLNKCPQRKLVSHYFNDSSVTYSLIK